MVGYEGIALRCLHLDVSLRREVPGSRMIDVALWNVTEALIWWVT